MLDEEEWVEDSWDQDRWRGRCSAGYPREGIGLQGEGERVTEGRHAGIGNRCQIELMG